MSIQIVSVAGEVLFTAEHAQDLRAAVIEAAKARADLAGAYLAVADLARADLAGANLAGANLARADLARANLAGANLAGANGLNPWAVDDLRILLDQPGKVRAYKLVNKDGEGPYNGGIVYRTGETVEVAEANTDEQRQCAPGISVATLPWCIREWRDGYRILVVEFTAKDIAAIPVDTDGKFRVRRCKVIGEKNLAEIGLDNGGGT